MSTWNPAARIFVLAATVMMITAAVVALLIVSTRNHSANVRDCQNQGGRVVLDTDRHYDTKARKWVTTREHECIVNGQEINEW